MEGFDPSAQCCHVCILFWLLEFVFCFFLKLGQDVSIEIQHFFKKRSKEGTHDKRTAVQKKQTKLLPVQYDANTAPGMEHGLLNSCSAHSVYVLRSTFSLFHYILNNYFPFFLPNTLRFFICFLPPS